jgi:hypothetical protein
MKTRDRLVLGILAVAGLMAALWFVALAPKREEAASLVGKVTKAHQQRDAANAKAANAEQARATYSRDYATVARLGKATPPQADEPSLVYQLENAARDAKVDFRAVNVPDQPAAPAPAPTPAPSADGKTASTAGKTATSQTAAGITPVPFTFTFEGSFLKLHDLLRAVDRFSRLKGQTVTVDGRLLTLDTVVVSAARQGFPRVKVEITARAYVAPIPDQLPAGTNSPAGASTTSSTATQVTK